MNKQRKAKRKTAAALGLLVLCLFLFSACGMDPEHKKAYDELQGQLLEEVGEENWKQTGEVCGWGMETPNEYNRYYFYIDEEKYPMYKHYWLEDIPPKSYKEGMNSGLDTAGDKVQYCINVKMLRYKEDIDYGGVAVKKDTDYFLVKVYDRAIYYVTVGRGISEDSHMIESVFDIDESSLRRKMLCHKERGKWIMEDVQITEQHSSEG